MHQSINKKNKIIIYLLFLILLSTTNGKFTKNLKSYSFKIDKINIIGLSKNENYKILKDLENFLNRNILTLGREEIRIAISRYNIIEEFSIKKIYPSRVDITIKPTKLIARISNNNQLLVGANGKLINVKQNNEMLPYVFGKFNSKDFLILKENIEQSQFTFTEFKALYFFPSKRWDILTNDDTIIKLPVDDFSKSLDLAYKMISSNVIKNKNFIDLRVQNHLIIK
ncbi:FtsQ-type POTRA domain-containing protein [Candidatus Pelagibacter sp.]|nr:FtsQ-type POTRA domain-containing protein [Candidatus Pelagibacter sp.]